VPGGAQYEQVCFGKGVQDIYNTVGMLHYHEQTTHLSYVGVHADGTSVVVLDGKKSPLLMERESYFLRNGIPHYVGQLKSDKTFRVFVGTTPSQEGFAEVVLHDYFTIAGGHVVYIARRAVAETKKP
jgi:hypothetical protein